MSKKANNGHILNALIAIRLHYPLSLFQNGWDKWSGAVKVRTIRTGGVGIK
jgi:hypothetical protein